jgi:hypothetical protein
MQSPKTLSFSLGVKDMKLEYCLSDKAIKQLFLACEDYSRRRVVELQLADLTQEAREAWLELYGINDYAELKAYAVFHGEIYSGGSVESTPPQASTNYFYLQDEILTPQTVSNAVLQALVSKRQAEAEAKKRLPEWEEARKQYEQRRAEETKEAEAIQKAEELMQPTIEKLEKRISELEGYLRTLIRLSDSETLEKAGLVHGVGEEAEEPELTPEQQEALETCGLDCDC